MPRNRDAFVYDVVVTFKEGRKVTAHKVHRIETGMDLKGIDILLLYPLRMPCFLYLDIGNDEPMEVDAPAYFPRNEIVDVKLILGEQT